MTADSRHTPSLAEVDLEQEAERLEDLAALADGNLDADRRAEILAQLDGDAEALDLLAELTALEAEVAELPFDAEPAAVPAGDEEAEDSDDADEDPVLPNNVVRGPWRKKAWTAVTTLAAVVALAVVAPRLLTPAAPTPQMMVSALEAGSPVDSVDVPWSPNRGGGLGNAPGSDSLSARDSFRLGVLAADLQIALAEGDGARLQEFGWQFDQVLGDSLLRFSYLDLADPEGTFAENAAEHAEMQEEILSFVDSFYYRYGLWVRSAWLAAASGQHDFFSGSSARSLGALDPPDEALRREVSGLRAEVRSLQSESDLSELEQKLGAIAKDHAN